MEKLFKITAAMLLTLGLLSACGIKGELDLPDDTDEQVKPY